MRTGRVRIYVCRGGGRGRRFGGPIGTAGNPLFERGNLLGLEFAPRGHGGFLFVTENLKQAAGLGIAGEEGGTGVTTLEQGFAGVDTEISLHDGRLGAVAGIALGGQQGTDVFFEERSVVGGQKGGEEGR
jgi:hypothetical protein